MHIDSSYEQDAHNSGNRIQYKVWLALQKNR